MPCCATTVSRSASATTWAATERAVAGLASASLRGQIPASRLRQAHGEHHHHHVAGRGADADGRAQRQAQPVAEHAHQRGEGGPDAAAEVVAKALAGAAQFVGEQLGQEGSGDRKSTRLNSSHLVISYAVFCLKKKKNHYRHSSQLVTRLM